MDYTYLITLEPSKLMDSLPQQDYIVGRVIGGTEAAEILYESLFLDKHSYSCYLEVISSHICHKHYITICECRWCHGSPVHRYGLYALQWIVEVNGKLTPDLGTFLEVVKVCLMLCTHGSVIKFKIL